MAHPVALLHVHTTRLLGPMSLGQALVKIVQDADPRNVFVAVTRRARRDHIRDGGCKKCAALKSCPGQRRRFA